MNIDIDIDLIIPAVIWGTLVFLIIYLIIRRYIVSKEETFEKRDN